MGTGCLTIRVIRYNTDTEPTARIKGRKTNKSEALQLQESHRQPCGASAPLLLYSRAAGSDRGAPSLSGERAAAGEGDPPASAIARAAQKILTENIIFQPKTKG